MSQSQHDKCAHETNSIIFLFIRIQINNCCNIFQKSLMILLQKFIVLFTFIALSMAQDSNTQPFKTEQSLVQKDTNHPIYRNEVLLGCWIYIFEKINNGLNVKEGQALSFDSRHLFLFNRCINKIQRKDAITKITSLAGRNYERIKSLESILGEKIDLKSLESLSTDTSTKELSESDAYFLKKTKEFEIELREMFQKGHIKQQVEQELAKKSTLLFGMFPVSIFTHSIVLVGMSVSLMCLCTWCRYFRSDREQRKEKKVKKRKDKARLLSKNTVQKQQ